MLLYWAQVLNCSTANVREIPSDYTSFLLHCASINLPMVFMPPINCHKTIKFVELTELSRDLISD